MIHGSCLCGNVSYEIDGPIGEIVHCHCVTCRKSQGSAFSSLAKVADKHFHLYEEDFLNSYESSPGKERFFCTCCGAQIYSKREGTDYIMLRPGTVNDEMDTEESHHIWIAQKALWYTIDSHLPQHPEFQEEE